MASNSKSITLKSSNGSGYTLTAAFVENSTSTENNTSNITVTGTLKSNGASWSSSYTSTLTIYWHDNRENKDVQVAQVSTKSLGTGATLKAENTINVTHNTDGSLSGYAYTYFSQGSSSGGWCPASGGIATDWTALTKIPRYASISQNLSSKTETSLTMNWSSDSTCNYIWYSINNGSSWTAIGNINAKSGSYTISGLSANTTYNVKTRVRRADSNLTSDSSNLSVATYSYPYATSMPNFTIGNSLTIGLYNPLGRSVTVTGIGADNSTIFSGSTSGTTLTGFNDSSSVNNQYASIPNSQSGTYQVKVTYGSSNITKTGGTYTVNTSVCSPSITNATYQDTNSTVIAITQNNQLIVRNQSTVQYNATGLTVKKSASIANCKVSVNNNTYNLTVSGTSASGGNAAIDSANDVTATITLTDSRGLTATKTITIQMVDWVLPTAIITLERQNNFYSNTFINVDANYSSVDSKNTITIKARYKKTTASSWSSYVTLQDNVQSTLNLDNLYEWNVQVVLTDLFGSTTYNLTLQKGMPIMYIDTLNNSVGVNCFPSNEESLEIGGKTIFDMIYPVGSVYISVNNTSPATLFGGTWEQIQDQFLLSAGSTYTAGDTGGSATHKHVLPIGFDNTSLYGYGDSNYFPVYGSGVYSNVKRISTAINKDTGAVRVGSSDSASSLPPYLVVYMWKRTA